ncbi:HET-domain-containing protein [Apiospora saccharicola]|uniref:HET-domain-containing protein n=1 Tax=Apiospora saccharicola TaxID=335842 RepID=A0ABR1U2R9_9PEZI
MPHYRYSPLQDSEIRLLAIWGSRHMTDDIVVTLTTFEQSAIPAYECLSYVWGSEDDKKDIRVTGSMQGSLPVTQNLDEAIRHLRHEDTSRIMWIDAICIDQSDLDERSRQVSKMGQIFKDASRVVFWLGREDNQSSLGMQVLESLGNRVRLNDQQEISFIDPLDNLQYGPTHARRMPPFTDSEWAGIGDVICRPWFNRLWIRQEIFLASSSAIVQCGTISVPWSEFLRALHAIRAFLARDQPDLEIVPDYADTSSAMEVYRRTVERYLATYQNLHILTECRYNRDSSRAANPTWVPDWSDNSLQGQLKVWVSVASSCLKTPIEKPVEGVLRVAGISAATIETLAPLPFHEDWDREDEATIKRGLQELVLGSVQDQRASIGAAELDAYTRTFVCDDIAENFHPADPNLSTLEDSKKYVSRMLAYGDMPGQQGAAKYPDIAAGFSQGRQLFGAQDGDFGLVPSVAQPGDQICVLIGCDTPILLRPGTDDTFVVIGECFMLSITSGQALIGKLPGGVRGSWVWIPEKRAYSYAFINIDTGETSWEDPRLDLLGIDLEDYRQRLAQNPWAKLTVDFQTLQKVNPAVRYFDLI